MMATPLLEVSNLNKSFSGMQVLQDVTFSVDQDSIIGVMGANGAGKTTLFSVIAGHHMPDCGEVRLRGRSLVGLRPDKICREGIARTFQIVKPFGGLTVLENVETACVFGSDRMRTCQITDHARSVIAEVGLSHCESMRASDLTLSNQKRLEVARAVATRPSLLLLDEVMAGLTATEVARMLETILQLRKRHGLTILVVEHVMQALMRLSDRIIVLDLGRMVTTGTPSEIRDNAEVGRIYFGEVH